MKEQERNAVLNAAVDFIVKKSGVDICKMCEWYNEEEQSKDENEDCCVSHRKDGDLACRQ